MLVWDLNINNILFLLSGNTNNEISRITDRIIETNGKY